MGIRVEHIEGPAFLASALVNGDQSAFDDEGRDKAIMKSFLEWVAPGRVVSTSDDPDAHFRTIYFNGRTFVGDVVTYVVHYEEA